MKGVRLYRHDDLGTGGPSGGTVVATDAAFTVDGSAERHYVCRMCGLEIAASGDRAGWDDGSRELVFANPHGWVYVIGRFVRVQGARPRGPLFAENTWFPGFFWRVCCCNRCGLHLGWAYYAATSGVDFWGMIMERLAEYD